MRPRELTPYFASAASLPGIGDKLAGTLSRLTRGQEGDARLIDLLFHLPSGAIDRRAQPPISEAKPGSTVTLKLCIAQHKAPPRGMARLPYRVYAHDDSGYVVLAFFHANRGYLEKLLPVGEWRYVSGTLELFNGEPQMVHPDHIVTPEGFTGLPLVEPVYPLTAGLGPKVLRRAIAGALEEAPDPPEWQDAAWLERQGWPGFKQALRHLHRPDDPAIVTPESAPWSRLAYDEILAGQLTLQLVRQQLRRPRGRSIAGDGRFRERIAAALPFCLTPSQRQALSEILGDLAQPQRMLRLLQGDVGSGKTVVALLACAAAVEAGGQAALMAPTEILARQHLRTIQPLAEAAGLHVGLLTGRERGREREAIYRDLAEGRIDIAVGTHALFQDEVTFRNLSFAVVDEQHRFGVHQRLALTRKGENVDLLVMTATPIPRTLVLTAYGDMDVSKLTEKPAGRQPVDTRLISLDRLGEVVDRLARAMQGGAQVYWVCPLVEDSELVDIAAAEERHRMLQARFGEQVGLVHGRMKGAEKDAAMARFMAGETRILVATTVIEVGVDVPSASIMVIEHAERFGLSQLHQLRGRIGRGSERSTCLLLYRAPLGPMAKARLAILRETEDGFRIAEEDLRLRGEGEILGTRQSGTPGFRIARLEVHGELLAAARDDAALALAKDPRLEGARGQALRHLLYLFEKDQAVRLLGAG